MLIKKIYIRPSKKDVWDLIKISPKPQQQNTNILFDHKVKKNQIAFEIISRINKKDLKNNFFNNIINIDNTKAM